MLYRYLPAMRLPLPVTPPATMQGSPQPVADLSDNDLYVLGTSAVAGVSSQYQPYINYFKVAADGSSVTFDSFRALNVNLYPQDAGSQTQPLYPTVFQLIASQSIDSIHGAVATGLAGQRGVVGYFTTSPRSVGGYNKRDAFAISVDTGTLGSIPSESPNRLRGNAFGSHVEVIEPTTAYPTRTVAMLSHRTNYDRTSLQTGGTRNLSPLLMVYSDDAGASSHNTILREYVHLGTNAAGETLFLIATGTGQYIMWKRTGATTSRLQYENVPITADMPSPPSGSTAPAPIMKKISSNRILIVTANTAYTVAWDGDTTFQVQNTIDLGGVSNTQRNVVIYPDNRILIGSMTVPSRLFAYNTSSGLSEIIPPYALPNFKYGVCHSSGKTIFVNDAGVSIATI